MSALRAGRVETPPELPQIAANESVAPKIASKSATLLRFITCGSVDDGKSTLIGRLMHEAGVIPDDQVAAWKRDSKRYGSASGEVDYALLVDGLAAEREQGITIDVAYRYFATLKRSFIVADTPGHEQYTRNMATGASSADLAIILIDARKGVLPQTRRHSFIVSLMGVRHIVVAVNKMDLVEYAAETFSRIEEEYRDAVRSLGFETITVIPVSARGGDNVVDRSARMDWYSGPTLLPYLESIDIETRSLDEASFTLPVQLVNRPNEDFRGYAGTIASGVAQVGADVVALPSGWRSKVARIVTADGDIEAAQAGQSVTFTLADEIDVSRGDVLTSPARRPRIRKQATARLLWTGGAPYAPGRDYIVKLGAATASVTLDEIVSRLDIESFAATPAAGLVVNDIGVVSLSFDRPLVIADFSESRELGGFILIDRVTNETVAFGFVLPDEWGAVAKASAAEFGALVDRALGQPGSALRKRRLTELNWRVWSAMIVAGLVWLGTDSVELAAVLGAADFVLRPLFRRVNAAVWDRALRARVRTDLHESGGGI